MDGVSVSRSRGYESFSSWRVSPCPERACTPYIGTTYKSFIRQARENPDPNIRYIAYAKLGSPSLYEDHAQKDEAVKIMIAKLDEGREPVAIRAAIIRSLGNLGDRRAREAILRGIGDTDNAVIRVEACRALGKVGIPEDATTLARIMTIDKLEDCRIAAIESIGSLKSQGTADLADPCRGNGPRRPGDPLSVPGISADDYRERLRNRSGRLEARAPAGPRGDAGEARRRERRSRQKAAAKPPRSEVSSSAKTSLATEAGPGIVWLRRA